MDPSKIKIKVEKEEEEEEKPNPQLYPPGSRGAALATLSTLNKLLDDMSEQLEILSKENLLENTSADDSNVATTTQTGGSTAPGEQDNDVDMEDIKDIKDIKVEGADGQN
ncbi:uncharacterized protein DMAD_00720 [Drosophila madeirensis]|uniref:EKC/KEOPS complex subunit GON7 n=1 Tax=Drosophila madeirensis TaxID=30013 RepID=A0AAU9FZL0_DROMD